MNIHKGITLLILLAVLAGGLWCAGCVSSEISPTSFSLPPGVAGGGGGGGSSSGYDYAPSAPYPTPAPALSQGAWAGDDQKIIKTANIDLEVQDVPATRDALQAIATTNGGYVGSFSMNRYGEDRLYASLVMRVPASAFDQALSSVAALGTLKSQSMQAEDVTEEYVDLQAQRTALAHQLAQYQRIMEKGENVSEIMEVQVQIERVQVEIDRIDGRLKYLDSRIDYATLTVSFREPEPVGSRAGPSITSVINQAIAGFVGVTAALFVILVSLIPLIILAIIVYAIYRWWKGRGKAHPEPAVPKEEKPGG